jgi:hypothetical protein
MPHGTAADARHTWRLAKRRRRDGSLAFDWYCRSCWQLRAQKAAAISPRAHSQAPKAGG